MKIYFSAAITQKHKYGEIYNQVINHLLKLKHQVQHKHISDIKYDDITGQTDKERIDYYKKAIKWISNSDIVIIEASFPSTIHIGHEISIALNKNKTVIVLYEKNNEPFFLRGLQSENLILTEYSENNLINNLNDALDYASHISDIRFNLMLPVSLSNFINDVSRNEMISKAEYIRQLVKRDKKERED